MKRIQLSDMFDDISGHFLKLEYFNEKKLKVIELWYKSKTVRNGICFSDCKAPNPTDEGAVQGGAQTGPGGFFGGWGRGECFRRA